MPHSCARRRTSAVTAAFALLASAAALSFDAVGADTKAAKGGGGARTAAAQPATAQPMAAQSVAAQPVNASAGASAIEARKTCRTKIIGEYQKPYSSKTRTTIAERLKKECPASASQAGGGNDLYSACKKFRVSQIKTVGAAKAKAGLAACRKLASAYGADPGQQECWVKACRSSGPSEACAPSFVRMASADRQSCQGLATLKQCLSAQPGVAAPSVVYWQWAGQEKGKAKCDEL